MRRKRELRFKKKVEIINFERADNIWESTYEYKCINSLSIATFVINTIGYSRIVNWDFDDIGESRILLKCTKEEFEDFITKFIKEFEDELRDIDFDSKKF